MAISDKIGSAYIEITADAAKYEKGVASARSSLSKFDAKAQATAKKIGLGFVAAGVAITGALTGIVLSAAKYGDEMQKMSLRTGLTVETLTELAYASEISGTNINTLENGLRFLSRAMDDVSGGIGESKETFEKFLSTIE